MTTTGDSRPPLYLTSSEAKNWFSLHSDDIGREVIIREWQPSPCPPEHLAAWQGFGRWERGMLVGLWPEATLFSTTMLERPPNWMQVITDAAVILKSSSVYACYNLIPDEDVPPIHRRLLDETGDQRRFAVLVGTMVP